MPESPLAGPPVGERVFLRPASGGTTSMLPGELWRWLLSVGRLHGWQPAGTTRLEVAAADAAAGVAHPRSSVGLVPGPTDPWPFGYVPWSRMTALDCAALANALEASGQALVVAEVARLRTAAAGVGLDIT